MKDRFMNGLVAGIVAGFAQSITSAFLIIILHFGNLAFTDFAGTMIYGRKPTAVNEYLFAMLAHLGYAGSVGIAFSFLLQYMSKEYLWAKGIYFGLGIWFFSYVITLLFKVPGLIRISFESAASNAIGACVYGLTLAWAINKLEHREEI